jgi:hypothetical protein
LRSHDERRFYTEWKKATKEFVIKRKGPAFTGPFIENASPKLIRLFAACRYVGVFLLEALDAACGVNQLLFAGEERVAIGANFNTQHVALDRGASLERMSASAMYGYGVIIGVDTGLHNSPFVVSGLRGKEP